ncbi:MAG: ferrous iron transport protein A, partial [Bacteroidaceae bacterium]|nr:ferrous iron transport protein A [Bacteroidaceae bacterium]
MTLRELSKGQTVTILKVGGEGALRQHFLDMGMIPGTQVTLQKYAPLGDPMELSIQGYTLTVRLADAEKIEVAPSLNPSPEEEENEQKQRKKNIPPRGEIGEGLH